MTCQRQSHGFAVGVHLSRILALLAGVPMSLAGAAEDPHSYANISEFRAIHASLDLSADFQRQRLSGYVDLTMKRLDDAATELKLDTRDLAVAKVELQRAPALDLPRNVGEGKADNRSAQPIPLKFKLGPVDATLGAPLQITLPAKFDAKTFVVRIQYQTSPGASGLQWAAALYVLAIAGDSCTQLDSAARHAGRAADLRCAHSHASQPAGRDERGKRRRYAAQR